MLQHFLEIKVAYNCAIGQELVLFNNKEILIENGKFLTFPEFIQKYEVECNFLNYMQVVSAIPKQLLKKAKEKQVDKSTFLAENTFQLQAVCLCLFSQSIQFQAFSDFL